MEKMIFEFCLQNYFPKQNDENVVALNGKYDVNRKDWLIFFKNGDGFCNYKSIHGIRQILYLTKLKHPLSSFPEEDSLWKILASELLPHRCFLNFV